MSKECYTRYEVERQNWVRWPRVLVVTELSPQGTAQRRYVPEESEKVVRCRDCRHAAPLEGDEQGRQICWLRSAGYIVEPDGFCSYGERGDA